MKGLIRWSGQTRPGELAVAGLLAVGQPTLAIVLTAEHLTPMTGRLTSAAFRPADVFGWVLLTAAPLAIAAQRRHPTAALAWVFVVSFIYQRIGYLPAPSYPAMIVAFVSSIRYGWRPALYPVLVAGYAVAWFVGSAFGGHSGVNVIKIAAQLLIVAAVVGAMRRGYRDALADRKAEAASARAEVARRRAGEERLRIAQDLHDVVAHHISLITVQAGVGLELFDRSPEQARASLAAVKEAGNTALGELRAVLEVLRDTGQRAPRAPAPVLSSPRDLAALVEAASTAGLTVRVDGDTVAPLPVLVDQAAYRIVQEALTNAVRHAGPGTTVTLAVATSPDELYVRVDDDGRGAASVVVPGAGAGIAGMSERANALGGVLHAGARPGGGFRVSVRLPLNPDMTASGAS
jgi:signal transduction histidine kinase